jgi:hypothetical protein
MARDGEILNKPLLQRMADYFNLGGVKRSPGFLNMDDVKAVYVLGGDVNALPVYSLGKSYFPAEDLGGASTWQQYITGSRRDNILNPFYQNDGYAIELVGLDVDIEYSEAGATSDNAVVLDLVLNRFQHYGSLDPNIFLFMDRWQTIQSGRLHYRFGLSGFNRGVTWQNMNFSSLHIPAGDAFQLVISRPSGGTWPADTSITIQAHVFTDTPQEQVLWTPGA